jgi:hypothetical protein
VSKDSPYDAGALSVSEVRALRRRIEFYESVMKHQPPHSARGRECRTS